MVCRAQEQSCLSSPGVGTTPRGGHVASPEKDILPCHIVCSLFCISPSRAILRLVAEMLARQTSYVKPFPETYAKVF